MMLMLLRLIRFNSLKCTCYCIHLLERQDILDFLCADNFYLDYFYLDAIILVSTTCILMEKFMGFTSRKNL